MPVAGRVANIFGAAGGRWNTIATSCHFATVYWLYLEEFSRPPTLANYATIGNPTLVVNAMLAHGRRLQQPGHVGLALSSNSVIVFARNNTAEHSCIATTTKKIGGYNQTNWFATPGANHALSFHAADDLHWQNRNNVRGNTGQNCHLYSIDERAARAVVRRFAR